MNWYQGGIEEAVRTSKQKGAIFVVYVEGQDEKSTELTNLINNEQVSEQLGGDNFVAVKVANNSVPLEQFRQIYKQVAVPSIFFIGKTGAPLEIITDSVGVSEFLAKLNQILLKHGINVTNKEVGKPSQDFLTNEKEESNKNADVVCEDGVCTIRPTEQPSTSSESDVQAEAQPDVPKVVSQEEKLEHAKELVNKTREAKKVQEQEAERLKEIERRKVGQDVQKLKRWQQDNDLKELVEERNKEKKEQQAARQRVLDQIAQDKADRAAKFASSTPQQTPTSPAPVSPRAQVDSDTARLQFRLPDGSSYTHEFLSSNTLLDVYNYIQANVKLPFQNYTLSTMFPRREYRSDEGSRTLLELELTPTAVILILPLHGVVETHTHSWFFTFLWSFIGPVLNFVGYLKSKITGGASASIPGTSSSIRDRKRHTDSIPDTSSSFKKRIGESSVVRRQGNVHRLADKTDSDDENNTWNGNSTQQM